MWGEDASEVCRNNQMSWTSIGPTALQTCGTATQHCIAVETPPSTPTWKAVRCCCRCRCRCRCCCCCCCCCCYLLLGLWLFLVTSFPGSRSSGLARGLVHVSFFPRRSCLLLPTIPRKKCAAGFELQGLSSSEPVISPRQGFSCVIGVPVYGRLQAACVPPHGAAARRLLASCRPAATAIAR